jgi:hypothetical protein
LAFFPQLLRRHGRDDQVANELEKVSQAGFAGTTITIVNLCGRIAFLLRRSMPRLEKKGLREKIKPI